VGRVIAVEKDPQLSESLRESLYRNSVEHVDVVTQDILKWDFEQVFRQAGGRIQVMGNLPYNISSPVLEKLVRNRERVGRAILMFQAEVAERLASSPGRKSYGALTVLIQYHAHTTKLLDISRRLFYPRPKVNSAVVELDFEKPYVRRALEESMFETVVRGAFAHRRKTILNSLTGWRTGWGREDLVSLLKGCGIDPGIRAEGLDMEGFLCLGDAVALTKGMSGAN
jgi:16S rRNA (adenine1518-N6/adenine1519-N6)-dimethyltransferase